MLIKFGAVSLVAMTLVCGNAFAQDSAAAPAATEEGAPAVDAAAPEAPQEVLEILNDTRPLADMNDGELRQRMRAARSLAKQQGLSEDVRAQLQAVAAAARAEMDTRAAAEKPAEEKVEEPAVEQPAAEKLEEPPPAVEPPVEEKAEEPAAEQPIEEKAEEPVVEQSAEEKAEEPVVEPPAEEKAEQPVVEQKAEEPAAPAAADVKKLDANPVSDESEAKARKLLADKTPADKLSDKALKLRLNAMRDLMETNTLSPKTERLLRVRLKTERDVLRQRQAAVQEEAVPAKPGKPKPVVIKKKSQREVLADSRNADELSPEELSRRLRVNRDVQIGVVVEVGPARSDYRRELIQRDRAVLRRRLLEERQTRAIELEREADDIEIYDDFEASKPVPRNVFEAEADDAEIEDILVSAPRKRIRQRYTIEEVAARSELREAMPRIEIDTIRFGFNEAFVREEEVENLDRIAAIIERVLRKRPREIFLIEGHTDAVGSDAYNVGLSRARAEAVKKALTTYYVINGRNLKTVGLGERYLKIPTAEAEGENRRVSISRATPLLGELDQ